MVAVAGVNFPNLCHLAGFVHEGLPACLALAFHAGYLGVGCHTKDGLQREIGVVSPVAGEVVGTELGFGVLAVVAEVDGPLPQLVHVVAAKPVGIAVNAADGCHQGQYVAAFLNGHVAAKSSIGIGSGDGIDLSVGVGVTA